MRLVIASVEQCHGICHRNIALKSINKSSFLTCWGKKKQDTNISYLELHMFRAGSSAGELGSGSLCFAELLQCSCCSSALCPEPQHTQSAQREPPLRKSRQNASLLPAHRLQNALIQNRVGSVCVTSFISMSTKISFGRTEKDLSPSVTFLLAQRYFHTVRDSLSGGDQNN